MGTTGGARAARDWSLVTSKASVRFSVLTEAPQLHKMLTRGGIG